MNLDGSSNNNNNVNSSGKAKLPALIASAVISAINKSKENNNEDYDEEGPNAIPRVIDGQLSVSAEYPTISSPAIAVIPPGEPSPRPGHRKSSSVSLPVTGPNTEDRTLTSPSSTKPLSRTRGLTSSEIFTGNPNAKPPNLIHKWIETGQFSTVRRALKSDKSVLNLRDAKQRTPLHIAASFGQADIAKYLLKKTKIEMNCRDKDFFTPAHAAALAGHINIVYALLKAGAEAKEKTKDGCNLLHLLVRHPWHQELSPKVLTRLTKDSAIVNEINDEGETPLHIAALAGNLDYAAFLLANGADLYIRTTHKETPLHYAMRGGHPDIVRLLLRNGSPYNVAGQNGTEVEVALASGRNDLAELFAEDVKSIEKKSGHAADQSQKNSNSNNSNAQSGQMSHGLQIQTSKREFRKSGSIAEAKEDLVATVLKNDIVNGVLNNELAGELNKYLLTATIPPITGTTETKVGDLAYQIWGICLQSLKIFAPAPVVSMQSEFPFHLQLSLTVQLKNINWKYTLLSLNLSDKGVAEAEVEDGLFDILLALDPESNVPRLVIQSFKVTINRLTLNISKSKISWVYNIILSLFSNTIKTEVEQELNLLIAERLDDLTLKINSLMTGWATQLGDKNVSVAASSPTSNNPLLSANSLQAVTNILSNGALNKFIGRAAPGFEGVGTAIATTLEAALPQLASPRMDLVADAKCSSQYDSKPTSPRGPPLQPWDDELRQAMLEQHRLQVAKLQLENQKIKVELELKRAKLELIKKKSSGLSEYRKVYFHKRTDDNNPQCILIDFKHLSSIEQLTNHFLKQFDLDKSTLLRLNYRDMTGEVISITKNTEVKQIVDNAVSVHVYKLPSPAPS